MIDEVLELISILEDRMGINRLKYHDGVYVGKDFSKQDVFNYLAVIKEKLNEIKGSE